MLTSTVLPAGMLATTLANLVLRWREEGEREDLERKGGGCDWGGKGERGEKRDQYSLVNINPMS